MNLDKFKLLKEDKDNYHIISSNGKSFKVEKSKLSDKAQAIIKKMEKMSADKYATGGVVSSSETEDILKESTDQDKEKAGKRARDEILKSYTEREGSTKGRDSRQKMLEPERFADGGMSSQQDPQMMTPSSPQTPQQMSDMSLPAGQSTQQQSDLATEKSLQDEDKGLETPAIAPDELLIGGVMGPGSAAAKAVGQEILGSEAGEIGGRKLIQQVTPEIQSATKDMMSSVGKSVNDVMKQVSHLPMDQRQLVAGVGEHALTAAEEHLGPDAVQKLMRMQPDQRTAVLNSLPEMKTFRGIAQKYINRNASELPVINKMAKGGQVKKYADGTPDDTVQDDDSLNMPSAGDTSDIPAWQRKAAIQQGTAAQSLDPDSTDITNSPADLQRLQEIPTSSDQSTAPQQTSTQQMPSSAPIQPSSQSNYLLPGEGLQKNAFAQQMAANKAFGEQSNAAIDNLTNQLGSLKSQSQIMGDYKSKDDQYMKSLQDQKIDPNRLWNNMSTGNRVMAGIGMLLSGIGGGLAHQDNLALKSIDSAINNDIEAQKNNRSNTMSLWQMNRQRMGDDLQANLATKNQLITAAQYQAMKAGNSFKTASSQANLTALMGQAEQEKAKNRAVLTALSPTQESTGGLPANSEAAAVNHINSLQRVQGMDPRIAVAAKDLQSKYVPGVGMASKAVTPADMTFFKDQDDLMQSIRMLKNFGAQHGGVLGSIDPAQTAIGKSLQEDAALKMQKVRYGMQRFSPDLSEKMETMIPDLTKMDIFQSKAKTLDSMLNTLGQSKANAIRHLNITPFAQ